jgi:hypothetical protein
VLPTKQPLLAEVYGSRRGGHFGGEHGRSHYSKQTATAFSGNFLALPHILSSFRSAARVEATFGHAVRCLVVV